MLSPITRVVELLQGMSARIEADGRAEEDLYETFVCWGRSIISQKTKSNAAAQSRADTLQTYINDLSSGRIELTTERVDLEKEVETLAGEIEVATQMREREARDFNMAKDEMNAAIDALTKAIDVLRTATQGHEQGVLMSMKGTLSEGSEARAREAAALSHAVELGKRVLTKGDAVFLQRLLTGDVPDRASWKKLNRKATFKMGYKARSFQIQGVLAKLLETFASNLRDAAAKEAASVEVYNKLAAAKGNEKNVAQDALSKMEKETSAKQASLGESGDERSALLEQINNDEGYIGQVQAALEAKTVEWKARQELRAGELAAIAKAVEILHSDDARDLFKKSFASQGFFLQVGTMVTSKRAEGAVQALKVAALKAHDSRLSALTVLASKGHFDDVIDAIDNMTAVLQSEEESDLQNKEACESDRAGDTRDAIVLSRQMDEATEEIVALTAHVAELTAEIEDKEEQVAAINAELNETADQRAKEHAEYLSAKSDDQGAADLIVSAKDTIETFYRDNQLMLMQDKQPSTFTSTAGEAPPPPPATWKGAYGGKTEETTGIVAILGMIHDDVLKDIQKADDEERAAVALYDKTKRNLETERGELTQSINDLSARKAEASEDIQDLLRGRVVDKGDLEVIMKRIQDAAPGCDFVAINFHVRSQNRKIEIDGLQKAKAILSGGVFHGLPDPNRELKPGDAAALVQTRGESRNFLRGHK